MEWISDDGGETYNRCHFWSNFVSDLNPPLTLSVSDTPPVASQEIGRLDFYRSEAYLAYFDFLDQSGGFWYSRWGDAPVHSIAAALFLERDEVHFFSDVGYRHEVRLTPRRSTCSSIVLTLLFSPSNIAPTAKLTSTDAPAIRSFFFRSTRPTAGLTAFLLHLTALTRSARIGIAVRQNTRPSWVCRGQDEAMDPMECLWAQSAAKPSNTVLRETE